MDIEGKTPMRKDAIFRVASMSKPVTGVAILMLMEEGKAAAQRSGVAFIPEFKSIKVATYEAAAACARGQPPREPEIYTVPAEREITIRDLMTDVSSGWRAGASDNQRGHLASPPGSNARAITSRLNTFPQWGLTPLAFQPGHSVALQPARRIRDARSGRRGRSGQTFDRFLHDRVFVPLQSAQTFAPQNDAQRG